MPPLHLVGFGRAGRAAEMPDRAPPAGLDVLDLPPRDQPERLAVEHLGISSRKRLPPQNASQADELAAREKVAAGGQRRRSSGRRRRARCRTSAAAPWGPRSPAGCWRNCPRPAGVPLRGTARASRSRASRKCRAAAASSGLHRPRLRQRATQNVHQAGRHLVAVEEIDQLTQLAEVLAGDRADDAPGRVASEPLHRFQDLPLDALALPVLARAVGHRGGRRIERNADADAAAAEERDGLVVQQRGVGLDAEAEIVGELFDAGEDRLAIQQRLGAVEDDLRRGPRAGRAEVAACSDLQGPQQLVAGHVPPAAAHRSGNVAIGAVQVAPLGGIEIDRRGRQAEAERRAFPRRSGPAFLRKAADSGPPRASSASFSRRTSAQKAVSGSTTAT